MTRLPVSALCLLTVCSVLARIPRVRQEPVLARAIRRRTSPSSMGRGARARRPRRHATWRRCRCWPAIALRTQGGTRRGSVRRRQRAAPRRQHRRRLPIGRGRAAARRPGAAHVAGPARDVSYRVDAPSAWVQISTPGEYRIACLRDATKSSSRCCAAAPSSSTSRAAATSRAGERTFARAGAAPSPAYVFNSAAWDAFDRWSEARRDQRLGVSAQYLPDEVRPYAPSFDSYGSWRYEQVYGYVWYPRVQVGLASVSPRPLGQPAPVRLDLDCRRSLGLAHASLRALGLLRRHRGSGFPGRSWAPAWVSWAYAPGYVSWCPLGWNNRPLFQLNVNLFAGRRYDPVHGWSVLPRHHFNSGYVNVSRFASFRVDPQWRGRFVADRGPDGHFAVNRSTIPIRTVGRYSGYRSSPSVDAFGGSRARVATSRRHRAYRAPH